MDKVKSVFASRTVITNAVTFAASLAAIWGFNLTLEQQAAAVSLILAIGLPLSTLFRIDATKRVELQPGDKKLHCGPLAVLIAIGVALSMGGCASLATAGAVYGGANAAIAAASPALYRHCDDLRVLLGAIDANTSERHQDRVDKAEAVLATVCEQQPASVPAAIGTAVAAARALRAVAPRT